MHKVMRSSLVALLLGVAAAPLAAQDIRPYSAGPERAGFWWGIGLGAAKADYKCPTCTNVDPDNFPMLDIHLGGTLSPKWTLGFELTGGQKDGAFGNPPAITSTVGDANISAYFYPSAAGNFWLQGGLTGAVYEEKQASNKVTAAGGGVTAGLGYDFRIGRNMSLTPSIRGVWGSKSDVKDQDNNTVATDFQLTTIQAGVSLIWH